MHKGIILLLKADNWDESIKKVKKFMNKYKGLIFSEWKIGGKFTGVLSPYYKKFMKEVSKLEKQLPEREKVLQKIWNELGALGTNPLSKKHSNSLYDVINLKQCIETVKWWQQTKEAVDKIKILSRDKNIRYYFRDQRNKVIKQVFCDSCNVYNIECNNYSIPENPEGWVAVVVTINK